MNPSVNNSKPKQFPLIREMMENNLSMIYYGDFSDKVNDTLIPFAESLIGQAEAGLMIRKRAFYILVECIQNVNRYHARVVKTKSIPREIFMVKEKGTRFNIALGNVIKSSDVKSLQSKITKLNHLSQYAIVQYYKSILKENILTHKGGAGLGLIEIARKSGNKIKFHFKELDEKYSYFSMETNVNDSAKQIDYPDFNGLGDVEQLVHYYKDHHFGLLLKSPFGFHSLSQVVSVINYLNNLDEQHFITNDQMADYLSEVQFFLKELFFDGIDSASETMVFHFERIGKEKRFGILWLSPNTQAGKCNRILQKSLPGKSLKNQTDNTTNLAFKEALKRLSRNAHRNITLSKVPFNSETTLFALYIPIS